MAFNFLFCPIWMRIPFVAIVSFGWSIMLSLQRGDPDKTDDDGANALGDDAAAIEEEER